MRTSGFFRKIDDLGRIVIPSEVRKSLGWAPYDLIEINWSQNTVTMRKPSNSCIVCGSKEGLRKVNAEEMCLSCRTIAARTLK